MTSKVSCLINRSAVHYKELGVSFLTTLKETIQLTPEAIRTIIQRLQGISLDGFWFCMFVWAGVFFSMTIVFTVMLDNTQVQNRTTFALNVVAVWLIPETVLIPVYQAFHECYVTSSPLKEITS